MRALLLAALACVSAPVLAQAPAPRYDVDLSGIDPAAVLAGAGDVMRRAPDQEVDGLYQAVLAASRSDEEAALLCTLFDAGADRSLAGLQRVANRLGPESRQRFAGAAVGIAMGGMQAPARAWDPAIGDQVLRRAGVTAMLVHEGFSIGMAATGDDPGSRQARCRSFRQLVDVLQDFALDERAAATRYLMLEGLNRYGREL